MQLVAWQTNIYQCFGAQMEIGRDTGDDGVAAACYLDEGIGAEWLDEGHLGDVDVSLESLDRVVRQIRSTIRAWCSVLRWRPSRTSGCIRWLPRPAGSKGGNWRNMR